MKYEVRKNGILICEIDTNSKLIIKFDKNRFPAWHDLEIKEIKETRKREISETEVIDNGN